MRWKRKGRGEKGDKPSPATIIFFQIFQQSVPRCLDVVPTDTVNARNPFCGFKHTDPLFFGLTTMIILLCLHMSFV